MPLISVIIPTHNGTTRFLDQALDSVFAQTYLDWELIIVDDASADDTVVYIQNRLQSCDHPAEYIQRSVNGGPSAARNDGARIANGTFLAFLDQDDLWCPTFLQETLSFLVDTPQEVGAIHTDGWYINASGTRRKYHCGYRPLHQSSQLTTTLCRGNWCRIQGMLVKRDAFESLHGFDERLRSGEDKEFIGRLHHSYVVSHLPKPLYSYRIEYGVSAHQSKAPLPIQLDNQFYLLQKQSSLCDPHDARHRKAVQAELARWYHNQGNYMRGVEHDNNIARLYFRAALSLRITPKVLGCYLRTYLPLFR